MAAVERGRLVSERRDAGYPFLRSRLRLEPDLRRQVEAGRGVGWSRFVGGAVTSRTTVERDAAGNVTGWVTSQDPQWTDEDRNLLLALAAEEREECDGCRQPLTLSTDNARMYDWRVHRKVCRVCALLEVTASNDAENQERGVKYSVSRETDG